MDEPQAEYTRNASSSKVSSLWYASEAVNEIKHLLEAVKNPINAKLIFQNMPKHMRRRAVSHHPKRLPRKYHTAHISQMSKSGIQQIIKRPSRSYRRRAKNLLQEYLRRQRSHIWMETHIWHARRFHMINRWGYRLPYASCEKTFRACYRASAYHCLLQDISFHACIEMHGTLDELKTGFLRITSSKCGLGITAKTYVNGTREGYIDLFKDDQYPNGALGRVSFIWRAEHSIFDDLNSLPNQRTLWIWVHPSCYLKVLEELLKVFQLAPIKNVKVKLQNTEANANDGNSLGVEIIQKNQKPLKFMRKTGNCERIKRYINAEGSIKLFELKNTMNRFRLTGPLSQSVLSHTLRPKSSTLKNRNDNFTDWFQKLLHNNEECRKIDEIQAKFWDKGASFHSPSRFMSNMVLALNIIDPRLHRPQVRTKALPKTAMQDYADNDNQHLLVTDMAENLHQSPLWNEKLRSDIENNIVTPNEYSKLRAKHSIVPGMSSVFEDVLQAIPILLIQRPGSQSGQGYGCGWDVIAPGGYGMPIWLSLIAWGARPGGLREFDSISHESCKDDHLPDTIAGIQMATESHLELYNRYFRLPPNKRRNYTKLAVLSPFRAPYRELVRDWLPSDIDTELLENQTFHILRDKAALETLAICLKKKSLEIPEISPMALIPVQLRMKSRGNLQPFSIICLPKLADYKRNLKQILREDHKPVFTEPQSYDCNANERKLLRLQHKRLLKRLRAKRVRRKRKQQETSSRRVLIEPACTATLVETHSRKMRDLWLPTNKCNVFNSVRKQCSRDVFGYVKNGGFSNKQSNVCGIGYVTVEGIKEMINLCKRSNMKTSMCLVRSPNTRNYRFATVKINLEN